MLLAGDDVVVEDGGDLVATHDEHPTERCKVRDDTEVLGNGSDAPRRPARVVPTSALQVSQPHPGLGRVAERHPRPCQRPVCRQRSAARNKDRGAKGARKVRSVGMGWGWRQGAARNPASQSKQHTLTRTQPTRAATARRRGPGGQASNAPSPPRGCAACPLNRADTKPHAHVNTST